MYDLIDETIKTLLECDLIDQATHVDSNDALKLTQAVCNLANAKATLVQTDKRLNE
tara:strand:- start:2551 stop:2718 length:168 start_codon:yes stop_codon:yes gene_type:complete